MLTLLRPPKICKWIFLAAGIIIVAGMLEAKAVLQSRSNVLFIICDDLNDWVLHPPGHPMVLTPNLDRLREKSLSFENAHAVVPVCGASRKTLFSGLYPQTIDDYGFAAWNSVPGLKGVVPIPLHFRNNGYTVYGTGKLLHEGAGGDFYSEWGVDPDYGPWPWLGAGNIRHAPNPAQYVRWKDFLPIPMHRDLNYGPLSNVPVWEPNAIDEIPGAKGWFYENGNPFQYTDDENRDPMPDELSADWAINLLEKEHDRPFFLAVGLMRPHTPLYVPKKYFDRFPMGDITLPPYLENDREDCASPLAERWQWGYKKFEALIRADGQNGWKEWVQAYSASVAFVDDQIGRVLDALEASPFVDNTIVILTSDHGYHVGEKDVIQKWHLWDESTRVPLIIRVPGSEVNGRTCEHPVSLIDVYPTLADFCDLPVPPHQGPQGKALDGYSLRPFLENPESGNWSGPPVALMAVDDSGNNMLRAPGDDRTEIQRHFSVRSQRYRYSLCANGEEELYDQANDPNEWINLASRAEMSAVKSDLKNEMIQIFQASKFPLNSYPFLLSGKR